jgi:hypothetical protein
VITASPYTALVDSTVPDLPSGEIDFLTPPERRYQAGPWLLAEAKEALSLLRLHYGKDLEDRLLIGLCFAGGEAHVVAVNDPEVETWCNPKFLIDGLGRWPAEIRWDPSAAALAIDTFQRVYWMACCTRPAWIALDGTIAPVKKIVRKAGTKNDRTTS